MAFTIKVQVIAPKGIDVKAVKQNIDGALAQQGEELKRWFEYTTATWSGEKPTFAWRKGITGSDAWVWCGPKGSDSAIEKWRRLDEGTPEHDIVPVRAQYLRFPWQGRGRSYLAKTTVGHLVSHPGGNKLGPIQRFRAVHHPGTEARRWSIVLGEQEAMPFRDLIQDAINRGLP